MYVGPWQELRALERAKNQDNEQTKVVEELERLRRAIDVVTNELEPSAATKIRRVLNGTPSVDAQSEVCSSISTSSTKKSIAQTTARSEPTVRRRRVECPRPKTLRSAPPARRIAPSYNARIAARLLRAERESRLKTQFWPWAASGRHRNKSTRVVERMRQNYIRAKANKDEEKAVVVEPFNVTPAQIDTVAKYFDKNLKTATPLASPTSSRAHTSPRTFHRQVPAAPEVNFDEAMRPKQPATDSVDELLHWALNLDDKLPASPIPAFRKIKEIGSTGHR